MIYAYQDGKYIRYTFGDGMDKDFRLNDYPAKLLYVMGNKIIYEDQFGKTSYAEIDDKRGYIISWGEVKSNTRFR